MYNSTEQQGDEIERPMNLGVLKLSCSAGVIAGVVVDSSQDELPLLPAIDILVLLPARKDPAANEYPKIRMMVVTAMEAKNTPALCINTLPPAGVPIVIVFHLS